MAQQPMPPQGAPPPPGPAPQGGGQAAGGPDQVGGMQKLLISMDKAIDQVNQVVQADKNATPEQKQMIDAVDQLFGKFLESTGAPPDQDDGQQGPGAQGQTVPPEAAGNKGAIPSPM